MTAAGRNPNVVLSVAAIAQIAAALVNFGLPVIALQLQATYGLSLFQLGGIVASGLLGSGLALTPAGSLVDRWGTRNAMLAGTALGTVGLTGAAFSSSALTLFGALLVFGIGTAVIPVAGAAALFRAFPPSRRGWAFGVRQMAVPLGGIIAAALFPILFAVGGVRLTLGVAAGALVATGSAFALIAGDDRSGAARVASPFRSILRIPGMRRLMLVAACYIVVLQTLLTYAVPAIRAAGESSHTASIAFGAINAVGLVGRIAWGRVADRGGGTRRVRTLVEIGAVASAGAVVFAVALHLGPAAIVVGAAIFGVGALGWNAVVYLSAGERVTFELAARAVAVMATVVFVISGLVTPVLGALADSVGWNGLWATAAVVAALGALLASGLGRAPLPASTPPR